MSLLTGETRQEMKLLPVAYPEKYGDQIGAALYIQTREGSRTAPTFRAAPGIADSEFLGEGGLGESHRGSWLTSFRKSYMGWQVAASLNNWWRWIDLSEAGGKSKTSAGHATVAR